ncbi:amino acid ABC transporter substrate-binding protein [Streptomyces sp. NBC_01429]|uniref:amino acid ABC transporter substrate-binding protein n=1 Tax=Streptomyces sp. NBC_01429 TaxID=2903862 RepID=UPI002E288BC0|nr:amino acid ABC transporter substrate-binding protein [Streptomyces sp. NBC_01429]
MWPSPGRCNSWPRPPEARPDIATAPAPIRIGYCLSLTGPLADNSRSARLAHEIWREGINSRGGLLGRPVELVCYDDQANADLVLGLYQRLIDEDKVDLVIGGYGTNTLLPAMPLIVERERFFVGLMGLGVNNALLCPHYFAMTPTGPDPNAALTEGFFALAAEQKPRLETVALVSADAEFSRNPVLGAKANAEKYGIKVVHETTYPLSTEDFTPVIDAVAESGSDLLFLCSYLADSIGLARTIRSHHFQPKMVGGAMIGPQNTAVKTRLGPLLNGFVNYEYWAPVPKMMFPGVQELLNTYQERAGEAGVDLLGHYMVPLAYAQMQVVAQAVEATGGFDDASLSAYAREETFPTVMGDVRFGVKGEWSEPHVLQVQFQGISGHEVGQFQNGSRQVVVSPPESSSGELVFSYAEALAAE